MKLDSLDFAIIIIYLLIMIMIGFMSFYFAKTREDYLVAGRSLNLPMFFGCMAALSIGGAATIGGAKLGYEYGVSGMWLGGSLGLGLIFTGMLITKKISKISILSINEILEKNYGPTARILSGILTFIYTVLLSVVQVISMGAILGGVLDITTDNAMLLGGGIVVFYTFIGGMWSVTMTDIVQFTVKTLGILVLAPFFAIAYVGGTDVLLEKLPESHFSLTAIGWDSILMYLLIYIPGYILAQDIWQRIFTARTPEIATSGTILAGVYSFFYAAAAIVLGMCVLVTFPELENKQDTFVLGITTFLPVGLRGFVLAAAMAATMGVASGSILASSTIVYNDLYKRFLHKDGDDKKGVWVNRGISFALGIVIMIFAFIVQDVLVALNVTFAFLCGCMFIPVVGVFVLKRFSPKAGLAALVVSTIVVTGTMIIHEPESNFTILFGMISGAIAFGLTDFLDKNKVTPKFED